MPARIYSDEERNRIINSVDYNIGYIDGYEFAIIKFNTIKNNNNKDKEEYIISRIRQLIDQDTNFSEKYLMGYINGMQSILLN